MRILVLSNEAWNDKINGNNVTSNWFEGMNAEFANIYASQDEPFNDCCQKYFQITDSMMLKSIVSGTKAGKSLPVRRYVGINEINHSEAELQKFYLLLKKISGPFLRFIREMLWLSGQYDEDRMKKFVDDFKPDVVFSERMASCKILRLEKIVSQMTNAPMFAFTGDDEYSLRQLSFSPFFWINRFMIRRRLRENVQKYRIYYTLSIEQANYYKKIFGCECKLLQKCGSFDGERINCAVGHPIRMIYAGKFYCNRWKMLRDVVDALKEINKDSVKIILEIYTKDKLTKTQNKLLNDGRNSFVYAGISQIELSKKYKMADIAIHVESLDLKNRLATRYSFSTKIIDCIFSGCAVMAYCWCKHSGLTYLKEREAAICVSSRAEMKKKLTEISQNTQIVIDYSHKAKVCGEMYHLKKDVQLKLLEDFQTAKLIL